ncbi:FusB/FusC family EF-G-binding protein [Tumebacillus sp. ITR2]|uniref:FusB/FusC family EF-G-binding protein n=1 Tax=Tumebacillus amylolyticus TaxID=2801339 RepID=A0ABS1J9I4_9BACL|nr:FusB/FusC family EF-G-binding protein [Tumebacillus amylolyticus]MBL0386931.1 FusB/FusC family EF-G-binding protein [Tumebacillus amylolyticus]
MEPFLKPYHLNLIRSQVNLLIGAFYFAGDYRVVDASRESALHTLYSEIHCTTPEQRELLTDAGKVRDKDELKQYLARLEPYVIPFPTITGSEIRKLFPKVKKLVLPDLDALDFSKLTYLGWRDIATQSLYVVYRMNGKWIGAECSYVMGPKNRAYQCTWCQRPHGGDGVALVTKQIKNRQIQDGYKVIGNHICLDSSRCNATMTDPAEFEKFITTMK